MNKTSLHSIAPRLLSATLAALALLTLPACGGGGDTLEDRDKGSVPGLPPDNGGGPNPPAIPAPPEPELSANAAGMATGVPLMGLFQNAYTKSGAADVAVPLAGYPTLTKQLRISDSVRVLFDPTHMEQVYTGPAKLMRIKSGVVEALSEETGLTYSPFGIATPSGSPQKQEVLWGVLPQKRLPSTAQDWSCHVNGGTPSEPFVDGSRMWDHMTTSATPASLKVSSSGVVSWSSSLTVGRGEGKSMEAAFSASLVDGQATYDQDGIRYSLLTGERALGANDSRLMTVMLGIQKAPVRDPATGILSSPASTIATFYCYQNSGNKEALAHNGVPPRSTYGPVDKETSPITGNMWSAGTARVSASEFDYSKPPLFLLSGISAAEPGIGIVVRDRGFSWSKSAWLTASPDSPFALGSGMFDFKPAVNSGVGDSQVSFDGGKVLSFNKADAAPVGLFNTPLGTLGAWSYALKEEEVGSVLFEAGKASLTDISGTATLGQTVLSLHATTTTPYGFTDLGSEVADDGIAAEPTFEGHWVRFEKFDRDEACSPDVPDEGCRIEGAPAPKGSYGTSAGVPLGDWQGMARGAGVMYAWTALYRENEGSATQHYSCEPGPNNALYYNSQAYNTIVRKTITGNGSSDPEYVFATGGLEMDYTPSATSGGLPHIRLHSVSLNLGAGFGTDPRLTESYDSQASLRKDAYRGWSLPNAAPQTYLALPGSLVYHGREASQVTPSRTLERVERRDGVFRQMALLVKGRKADFNETEDPIAIVDLICELR